MTTNRLEAFSDGVMAVIITIMVLELKPPHGADWAALHPLVPVFLSYVLSFVYVGIYWNNHHHLCQAAEKVGAGVMWANLHLLFWLSLIPFSTAWMGENHYLPLPVAAYGCVLLMAAVAYWILERSFIGRAGDDSLLSKAVGDDYKGKASPLLYAIAIPCAYVHVAISAAIYVAVAVMWLLPDPRIEKELEEAGERDEAAK